MTSFTESLFEIGGIAISILSFSLDRSSSWTGVGPRASPGGVSNLGESLLDFLLRILSVGDGFERTGDVLRKSFKVFLLSEEVDSVLTLIGSITEDIIELIGLGGLG